MRFKLTPKGVIMAIHALDADLADEVLTGYLDRGGSRQRWLAPDHFAMADAITEVEDRLELMRSSPKRLRLRLALRDLRRAVEDEENAAEQAQFGPKRAA